jgi:pyruvate dehydrogenase E2 component (dihydrolipoamide acetyltransferase)
MYLQSFDAVDDSFLAKILVDSGTEVAVGQPIMVTVEEESDVAAFSSFSVAPAASTPSVPTPEPVPAVSVPTPPTPPSPPPTPVKQVAPPSPEPPAAPPTPTPAPVSHAPTTTELQWGSLVKSRSPLAAKIAKDQQAYVEKYGNSSHIPLDC